jgi:hypothetical protein
VSNELDPALRIGKLEATFELYKPIFRELQGMSVAVNDITNIQKDLRVLRDSRIEMKGELTNLLSSQDKIYKDTANILQDREKLIGEEVASTLDRFETRLGKTEEVIDSFKLKGWETLSGIIPWVIATSATVYAIFK